MTELLQTFKQKYLENVWPMFCEHITEVHTQTHTPHLDSKPCNIWKYAFNTGSGWEIQHQLHVSILFLIWDQGRSWEGGSKAAYQGTTLSWAPKPFMTAEQSGFGTEVTAHTYQADNLIF